jgi:hypothetical protein
MPNGRGTVWAAAPAAFGPCSQSTRPPSQEPEALWVWVRYKRS